MNFTMVADEKVRKKIRPIRFLSMENVLLHDKSFELFLTQQEIIERVKQLAAQINSDYKNKFPVLIGVLNGSFMFMADLMKEINIDCKIEFIKVSSYDGGTKSTGNVLEILGLGADINGKDVIIVDTGKTLTYLLSTLNAKQPSSIKVVTLLLKPEVLETQIPEIQYIGFEISNHFVVGYGMDYNHIGRNLKDIY